MGGWVGWGGSRGVKVKQCSGATSWYIPATPQHTPSKVLNICYLSSEDCRAEIWLFKNVLLLTLLNIKILCCGHPASQSEKPFRNLHTDIYFDSLHRKGDQRHKKRIYICGRRKDYKCESDLAVCDTFLPPTHWCLVVHRWHWGSSINSSRHPHEVSQHRVLNVTQFPDHLYLRAGPLCQRQVGKVRSSAGTHKHSCVRIPCV